MDQTSEQATMERSQHGARTLAWDNRAVSIHLRPYLRTVSAAAEHVLWQRILRSVRLESLLGKAFACPEPGWFRLVPALPRQRRRNPSRSA